MPADSRLGAAVRSTGEGAEQDPHWPRGRCAAPQRWRAWIRPMAWPAARAAWRRSRRLTSSYRLLTTAGQRSAQGARLRTRGQPFQQTIGPRQLLERIRKRLGAFGRALARGRDHPATARVDHLGRPADIQADDRQAVGQRLEHDVAAGIVQARVQQRVVPPVKLAHLAVLDPGQPVDRMVDLELGRQAPPGRLVGPATEHRETRLDAAVEQAAEPLETKMHALPIEEAPGEQKLERLAGTPLRSRQLADLAGADLQADVDLVLMARRQGAPRLGGLDVDHERVGAGLARDRVEADQPGVQVAQGVGQPAAPAEAAPQRQGRPLAAAERSHHHRDRQPAHQGRVPDAAEGDVMDQIDLPVRELPAGVAVGQDLPEQVDQMPGRLLEAERDALALQPVEPGRHEELEAERGRQAPRCHLGLDLGAQLGLGQRDHLMAEARGLDRPVPADPFLRAAIRAAGEHAHEDTHWLSSPDRGRSGGLIPSGSRSCSRRWS